MVDFTEYGHVSEKNSVVVVIKNPLYTSTRVDIPTPYYRNTCTSKNADSLNRFFSGVYNILV